MIECDANGRVTDEERVRLRADAEILRRAAEVLHRRGWDGDNEASAVDSWADFAEDMAT